MRKLVYESKNERFFCCISKYNTIGVMFRKFDNGFAIEISLWISFYFSFGLKRPKQNPPTTYQKGD